jgi:hypothetical protein
MVASDNLWDPDVQIFRSTDSVSTFATDKNVFLKS